MTAGLDLRKRVNIVHLEKMFYLLFIELKPLLLLLLNGTENVKLTSGLKCDSCLGL